MSASKLSRMDQLLSRNGSYYNNNDRSNYRINSSFENQLSFVKGYIDRQSQSTYMNSDLKNESNIYNYNGQPLTNRLPPSNKKSSSYLTPQKQARQVLSSSIFEKDTNHQRNYSNANIRLPESEQYLKNVLKEITSTKKQTPKRENSLDYCRYEKDDRDLVNHSETPCQRILKSIEKENCVLKSELKDHNEEMRDINKRIRVIEKENKQLRQALQKYIFDEENQDKIQIQKENETILILQHELVKQNAINKKLNENIEIMEKQNVELEDEKEKIYKKCVILAKKLRNFQNTKEDLQEKIFNIEPQLDKQNIKNELLEQDARHLQMELDFWRQKAEDQEYQLIQLQRNDERLRIKLQEYEDIELQDKEKQMSELNAFKSKYKQLEIDHDSLKQQIKTLKAELGNNNFSQESAQDIIANLKAKLHVETSRADSCQSRERDLKKRIEDLEVQFKEINHRNVDLEFVLRRLDIENNAEEDINNGNYEKVLEKISLIRQKNKVEDIGRDQNYLLDKLHRDLEVKETEIKQLKENFDSLYVQLIENQNMLKEEISLKNKVEQEKQQQMVELNSIKKEISHYKQNLESFKQNLTDSQIRTSRSKPHSSDLSNNNFGDKLKMLESTIADVQNKKKQINQDNQLLKQRLQNLDTQLSHRSQISSTNLSQQ